MNRTVLKKIRTDLLEAKKQIENTGERLLTSDRYPHNCLGLWNENEKLLNKIYDELSLESNDNIDIFELLELDEHYNVQVQGVFVDVKKQLIEHIDKWIRIIEKELY